MSNTPTENVPGVASTSAAGTLTVTRQLPHGAVITLDEPLSTIHRRVAQSSAIREGSWRSIRAATDGMYVTEVLDHVEESPIPDRFAGLVLQIARGNVSMVFELFHVLETLGHVSIDEALVTLPTLFAWSDVTPTIAFYVTDDTRELDRAQREDLFGFIDALSRSCDVRLVATGPTRLWLVDKHRDDLPGVSEQCNIHQPKRPLTDVVETALRRLDPESRAVTILRQLANKPGRTVSRHELTAVHDVDRSRLSQILVTESDSLESLGLVEQFGPQGDRKVELLEAGREYLRTLDCEIGRQRRLDECVSESGQSHLQCRVTPPTRESPPDRPVDQSTEASYRTRYLGRPEQVAAVACSEPRTISTVTAPVGGATDTECRRTRYVGYDDTRDEAVVGVYATTPLQYTVSLATALASPRSLNRALPESRLKESINDVPPSILRDARNIGALSDEVLENAEMFREALIEWGENLAELTTKLNHGEYDDRDRFRGKIMRSAHGLAGTITHILDLAGVDLVREVRVPAGLTAGQHADLAESIAVSAAIQSRYGHFATYRQLFESREEKRSAAIHPDVDATDPHGELLGSFVIRGTDVHRLESHLERHLGTPHDLHDDAPEFTVPIPLRSVAGREPYSRVGARILGEKNLRSTRDAISLIHALVGSPYDAAHALYQLGSEEIPRDIQPRDIRYALSTLETDRVLPDHASTLGAVVSALLSAETPVSTAELADRADVSERSVRRHRETVAALAIVAETDEGWRLELAGPDTDGTTRYPKPIVDDLTSLEDLILEVAAAVTDPERLGDPEDPLFTELSWGGDPWRLREDEALGSWIDTLAALVDRAPSEDESATVVEMGSALSQQPLTDSEAAPGWFGSFRRRLLGCQEE